MNRRKRRYPKPKYPPYPGSNWDYAIKHIASQKLVEPNKSICIYCHAQALTENKLVHLLDCPVAKAKTMVS